MARSTKCPNNSGLASSRLVSSTETTSVSQSCAVAASVSPRMARTRFGRVLFSRPPTPQPIAVAPTSPRMGPKFSHKFRQQGRAGGSDQFVRLLALGNRDAGAPPGFPAWPAPGWETARARTQSIRCRPPLRRPAPAAGRKFPGPRTRPRCPQWNPPRPPRGNGPRAAGSAVDFALRHRHALETPPWPFVLTHSESLLAEINCRISA